MVELSRALAAGGVVSRVGSAAVLAGLLLLVAAPPASAQAQSKEQQKCIGVANKQARTLAKARGNESSGCISTAAKVGAVDVDACNSADTTGKVSAVQTKATALLTPPGSKCDTAPDFGFSSPLAVTSVSTAVTAKLFTDIYDANFAGPLSTDESKCLDASLKALTNLFYTQLKAFRTCKKPGLKDGSIASGVALLGACLGDVENGPKVIGAKSQLEATLDAKCLGVAIGNVFQGDCVTAPNTAALAACMDDRSDCDACLVLSRVDNLGADCDLFDDGVANSSCIEYAFCGDGYKSVGELCDPSDPSPSNQMCPNSGNGLDTCSPIDCTCACPTRFDFTPDAADASSLLDNGWTGLGHNERWISDATVTVSVDSCDNATKPCGTCSFSGPVANVNADNGDIHNRRCIDDTSQKCAADVDCTGFGGTCSFWFGAPLPLTNGGAPLCVLQRISDAFTGTVNVSTGDSSVSALDVKWKVYLGISVAQPCPRCSGDAAMNDGVAGGTCDGGHRSGLTCDANATSPITSFGPVSLDCPPTAGSNVSGAGLGMNLDASTGSEVTTLAATSPDCRAAGFTTEECFCDVCTGDLTTPCSDDDECAALLPGTCGAAGGGEPTRPNACTNPSGCVAQGGNEGACSIAGPVDMICDGATDLRLLCLNNADCVNYDPLCPGADCGDCLVGVERRCFLTDGTIGDQLIAAGAPDLPAFETSTPILAATTCIGFSGSPAVNFAAGWPGPVRLNLKGLARALP